MVLTPTRTRMTPLLTVIFGIACGMSVANLYYAQPLLPTIARTFHTGSGVVSLAVTGSQIGYGVGLAFLVPLGDLLVRRRLIPTVLLGASAGLFVASLAPSIAILIVAVIVAGICSVVAQILVPFAAHLADDATRGRVVGTVMSGLLLGILLARTFAGLIAQVAGWRTVYVVAGAAMLVLAGTLLRVLPGEDDRPAIRYAELLGSVVHLMRTERVLRLRSVLGALAFATFNVMWTSIAFLLAASPYHYSQAVIGLFGLLGAGGALAASFSGRLADRGYERLTSGLSLCIVVGSCWLLFVGTTHLIPLMAGVLLVDLGIQSIQIQNQQLIYALQPEARSRLNSGYMVTYFIGGSLGSATTGITYAAGGWHAVVELAAAFGVLALLLWAASEVLALHSRQRLASS
jgi:predicted MFS family arabinose efflux permease